MSANRFDFEQQIMQCWGIVEDIDELYKRVCEDEMMKDSDTVANYLLGMKTIYQCKFDTLFRQFEQLVAQRDL